MLWSYDIVCWDESPTPKDILWNTPMRAFSTREAAIRAATQDAESLAEDLEVGNEALVWEEQADGGTIATPQALRHWVRVFPMGLD